MRRKIIELMEEIFDVPAGTITEETCADDLEEWDSLGHLMLMDELKNRLDIEIPMDEMADISSVLGLFEKAEV